MVHAINAVENSVPPLLILPRKFYKDHMIRGVPTRSVSATNLSGLITRKIFSQWLIHFIKHADLSENRPVLLAMDNHDTHITLEVIETAKKKIFLQSKILHTPPSHMSHLDRCVYSPLKIYYNNKWLINHLGNRHL